MKRILFLIPYYSHQIHRGVARYCGEHGWYLNNTVVFGKKIPETWDGDGIITEPGGDRTLKEILKNNPVPIVYINSDPDNKLMPSICPDHQKISKIAAEYLLNKGFKRFICYFNNRGIPSRLRKDAFCQIIENEGGSVLPICIEGNPDERARNLRPVLRKQTFPVAIFTTADEYVGIIVEACKKEGLRIPEDVAVLGVKNDETRCLAYGIPISSIEINLDELGYQAAALLNKYMDNPDLPAEHHIMTYPPNVVSRKSTDILAIDNPVIARALRYINDNYKDELKIEELARFVGVSRAGLFNAFKHEIRRTPGQETTRVRVEHAKRLLLHTEESLKYIAFDSGFQTAHNMYVAFRKLLGISPKVFREQGAAILHK